MVLLDINPDENEQWEDNFREILETLDDCIKAGKIRHIGLSNESPWGAMKYLALSEFANLPRMKTIQNPYSLLNRKFEVGNAEVAHREQLGLLAYSPMAFGILSGKYRGGKLPENSRLQLFPRMARYNSEESLQATELYAAIADKARFVFGTNVIGFCDRPTLCDFQHHRGDNHDATARKHRFGIADIIRRNSR